MPTRTSRDHPRYDASVQRNVKNVYDRDPLLIPQLFEDTAPPWYRRRSWQILAALLGLCLTGAALMLFNYGLTGTAERTGRLASDLLRGFASAVGG
jgi:hypothetical protein